MDDYDGTCVFVASKAKKIADKADSGMLTDPREFRHQGFPVVN